MENKIRDKNKEMDNLSKGLKNIFIDMGIDYDEYYKMFLKDSGLSDQYDHEDGFFMDLVVRYF